MIVKENTVDDEADILIEANCSSWEAALSEEEDEDLRPLQINVRTWRDRAQREYLSRTRRFWALQYAGRHVYKKHLPPGRRVTPGLIEGISARTNVSKFYKEIPPDVMLVAFLHGVFFHFDSETGTLDHDKPIRDEPLWNSLLCNDKCRIVFRSRSWIGASNGLPAKYLCYELDASTPIVHVYPISEQQANIIRGGSSAIMTDELAYWGLVDGTETGG